MDNKIDPGLEILVYELWQKSEEIEEYLAKLEVLYLLVREKK